MSRREEIPPGYAARCGICAAMVTAVVYVDEPDELSLTDSVDRMMAPGPSIQVLPCGHTSSDVRGGWGILYEMVDVGAWIDRELGTILGG